MPLHPQAASLLQELSSQDAPGWSELPPAESREIFAGFTELFGQGPDLPEIGDLETDTGLPLRIYRPQLDTPAPAMMYFHGGGWVLGDLDTHDTLCRKLAAATRRTIVAVDYRRAPENRYPAALHDCYAATSFVAKQASRLGIDGKRLGVAGDSAGGNLAAAVCLRSRDESGPSVDCQVLIYPVIEPDFDTESYQAFAVEHLLTRETMQWFWKQYADDLPTAGLQYAALQNASLEALPPALVMTAEYDVLRDEGETYAKRLQAAGNRVTIRRYPGMLHGFVHFSGLFDDGNHAIQDIAEYLDQQV